MMNNLVQLDSLSKRFGDFNAVSNINLCLGNGETFALLGPNGAGKTTTIRMMMGILQPSNGNVRIRNYDCFTEREHVMHHVGYLPDDPIFYDYLSGRELIRYTGKMHGLSNTEILERSTPLIERLALTDALDEYATNYSKGMKKKLASIMALLHEPDLLILDEPTNGLDPYATRTMHELVEEQRQAGTSIFFSTHLLDQAERLCTRIGILYNGKLAAVGDLEELRGSLQQSKSLEDIFFEVTSDTPSADTFSSESHEPSEQISPVNDRRTPDE